MKFNFRDTKPKIIPYIDACVVQEVEFYESGEVKRVIYRSFVEWPEELRQKYIHSLEKEG